MQLLFRETVPALFTRPETDECGHLWTACSGTGHHVFRHEGTQFPNLFQPESLAYQAIQAAVHVGGYIVAGNNDGNIGDHRGWECV